MYAVIETGGKQYKVSKGDIITVEKLGAEDGSVFEFGRVLAVCDDGALTLGAPSVGGASVSAFVLGGGKAKKVVAYKFKAKKGYHRKKGHRQPYTRLRIDAINTA